MNDWVWMPHPAHLIVADRCQFRLATYIPPRIGRHDGVIVSTVGEYKPPELMTEYGLVNKQGWTEIGSSRLYETMVFKAVPAGSSNQCCPYHGDVESGEQDFNGYNSAKDAFDGHMEMCKRWSE